MIAPLFGALLDFAFFSRVPPGNRTAKIVMALGLMVILPQVVLLLVGQNQVLAPPTPFLSQGIVWTIGSVPIIGQQICQVAATFAVLAILAIALKTRRFGLPVRAAVESPKLLELSGVDSRWVLRAAWMVSTSLAALAGVLYAPVNSTIQFQYFDLILVAAVAAAALGGLRNLPLAVLGGILLGVIWGVVQGYVPPDSVWYIALVPSLPFFMLLLLLIFNPTFRHLEDTSDPMAAVEPPPPAPALALRPPSVDQALRRWRWPVLVLSVVGRRGRRPDPVGVLAERRGGAVDRSSCPSRCSQGSPGSSRSPRRCSRGSGRSRRASCPTTSTSRSCWRPSLAPSSQDSAAGRPRCPRCASEGSRSPCSRCASRCSATRSCSTRRGSSGARTA